VTTRSKSGTGPQVPAENNVGFSRQVNGPAAVF
jgi:hypothetical protein